jgi:hypothetical protein
MVRRLKLACMLTLLVAVGALAVAPPSAAQERSDPEAQERSDPEAQERSDPEAHAPRDPDESAAQVLAERYAPIFMLKEQEGECDRNGEAWKPMAVDAIFDNRQIALRQVGNDDPVVMWGPSASDVAGLGKGFYLDFPGSSLTPGCIYERDYRRFVGDQPSTIYAHVVVQPDRPDELVLQYWTYWYFNDWNNTHESDWEAIQIVFPASSVEEALQVEPSSVGYAQHEGGESADWDADKLEREGSRPVVYSSAGSHASYFGSALYLGRSGSEGFGCDNTDGPSVRVDPQVVLLPHEPVTDLDDPLAWTSFGGRWGERQSGPFNGPDGPYQKGRWDEPLEWNDGLRSSSVVVPAGDGQATALFEAFCGVVEFGSNQLLEFKASPTRALVTLVILGGGAVFLLTRTTWSRVDPLPVVRRRQFGQILRAIGRVFLRAPILFTLIGIASLPLAFAGGLLTSLIRWAPFVGRMLVVSESDGAWRLVLSVFVGSLANVITLTAVVAAVAWTMAELSAGRRPEARDVLAAVVHRGADLARGLLRAMVIVVALVLSVIGIPFAIRQLIRYQFLPQATVIDGLGGRAALDRSAALVRGRWWHTGAVIAVANVVIAGTASVVGLLFLVVLRPSVLLLTVVVSVASLLTMPLVAIAVTLLYGDAVRDAEDRSDEPEGEDRDADA